MKLFKLFLSLLLVPFIMEAQTMGKWYCRDIVAQNNEIGYISNKYSKDRFVAEAIRLSTVVNPTGEIKHQYKFYCTDPCREDILVACLDEIGVRTGANKWVVPNASSEGSVSQTKKVKVHYDIEIIKSEGTLEYNISCKEFEEFGVDAGYWRSKAHLDPNTCFPLDKGGKKGAQGRYYTFATKEMIKQASTFEQVLNNGIKNRYSELLALEKKQREEALKQEAETKQRMEYDSKLNQLKQKYGQLTCSFGIGGMNIDNEIHVFANSNTLVLYGETLNFKDVISSKLLDETTVIEGRTTTRTLGGEFWFFGVGVGQKQQLTQKEADKTIHHYYVDLKLDRWTNNFITIDLGGNKDAAETLNGVFEKIIREKNASNRKK